MIFSILIIGHRNNIDILNQGPPSKGGSITLHRSDQLPPPLQVKKRKWTCIGHMLGKDSNRITHQALRWNPQGKWKRHMVQKCGG